VDSLSEIFGAVAAFTFFAVEKELVGMDGTNMWNVTFPGNSTLNYIVSCKQMGPAADTMN
jgi:hypothetical protein